MAVPRRMKIPTELVVLGPASLRGRLRVPGDKGISHRALLFASMANGRSRAVGLAGGDDVARTRLLLRDLGVDITAAGSAITVEGRGVEELMEPSHVLDCGNSGTTMRTAAGLLAGRPFLGVLSGDVSLLQRPMGRVVEPLRAMGAHVDGRASGTLAPLALRGGSLRGYAHHTLVASAQVKTALVLAGLQADGTTEITEPAPTRDHTERMLRALGAPVTVDGCTVRVTKGAPAPLELEVPGDPSSAAFWVVGATITPGSDLVIERVCCNPTRIAFVDVLRRMGATIDVDLTGKQLGEPVGDLRVVASELCATTIGGDEIPLVQDELPVLAVAAAFADGVTEIADAAELRVKETDRIATVEAMLVALGVGVETASDTLAIRGGQPRAARLDSYGDHRLAMAAAIAANAADGESVVLGWKAISVSYPEFGDDLATLTGRV
ncbi:MAG: 3-phosphoshikimate 1-carboxyvinyltransferase [Acidimicrobiia bacterium]